MEEPNPNSDMSMADSDETLDESCLIEANVVESSPNQDQNQNQNPEEETLSESSPISWEEEEEEFYGHILPVTQSRDEDGDTFMDPCSSDLPDDLWNLFPSPSYDTDDDEDDLKHKQEKEEHVEPYTSTGVGPGIRNLGNSCFLNSVLQCLGHTVPFVQSVRSYKYQRPCNCGGNEGSMSCAIYAIQFHLQTGLRHRRIPINPFYFLKNLSYYSPDFRPHQQEDAQEFLSEFLDKLERCCLDRKSNRDGSVPSQDNNIVDNVFGGRFVSMLRCCNCGSISKTFEPSVGMSLEIGDADNNLWKVLASFTRWEELDEQLTCDECNQKVTKEKRLMLDKIPLVAMFHLKRFKNNGLFMEKITKHVKFPLELDLEPYMMSDSEDQVATKYRLYAFVEHLGALGYGHYCSFVRSAPKTWHKFDDDKVTSIDEDSVIWRDAYMLFYVKEDTPWFSRAFEEMDPLLEANFSPISVLDPSNGECVSI